MKLLNPKEVKRNAKKNGIKIMSLEPLCFVLPSNLLTLESFSLEFYAKKFLKVKYSK